MSMKRALILFLMTALAVPLAAAPSFYMATDRSFGQAEHPYVNIEGPGGTDYDIRVYRVDAPVDFFRKAIRDRLVAENNETVQADPLALTKNTWRRFKAGFRASARREFRGGMRRSLVASAKVDFSDTSVVDPEEMPGYLKGYALAGSFRFRIEGASWEYRRVPVPVSASGVYLVEAVQGKNIGYTVIVKSNLNFVVKQSDAETLVYTAFKDSGLPATGADILFVDDRGAITALRAEKDGTVFFRKNTPVKSHIIARKDAEFAVSDPSFFASSFYGTGGVRVFMYTDRPVYRPGDEVFFKGIIRNFRKDSYSTVSGSATVSVFNAKDEPVIKDMAVSVGGANGTCNGTFSLPNETYLSLGTYTLVLNYGGERFSTEFGVEAYKKPSYLVKVTSAKPAYTGSGEVKVNIAARFHYGEPVKNAAVTYRVFRRPKYDYSPVGALPFFADAADYLGLSAMGGSNELVMEKSGKLDDEGTLAVAIKPGKIDRDYTYSVIASVSAEDATVDGSGSFSVNRSAFHIRVVKESTVYAPGDEVVIRAELVPFDTGLAGKKRAELVAARKVSLELLRREFVQISQEAKRTEVESLSAETNAEGVAVFRFKVKDGGHYAAVLTAKDTEGEKTDAESSLWVSGQNDSIRLSTRNLSVTSGKDLYAPGDTADILIVSPVSDGHVLITLEGNYIYRHETVKMKGNSLRYRVKIDSTLTPNFTVSAVLFANNEIFRNQIKVAAPPLDKFIQVAVKPAKPIYAPGETAELALETTVMGKPVAAEVSLAVVDVAVYQIREDRNPPITTYFYHPRQNNVSTTYSAAYRYFGYSEEKRMKLALARRGVPPLAAMKEEAERDREKFKDTAFWTAAVTTGSDGKGKISFRLPDNITAWRVNALAVTPDTKVGQTKQEFIARKDLMITPGIPMFVLRGAKQTVSANISNLTRSSVPLAVKGSIIGGSFEGAASANTEVKAGGSAQVSFTIKPYDTADVCIVRFEAAGGGLSDAVKISIPVRANGIVRSEGAQLRLDEGSDTAEAKIVLPEKIESAKLVFHVTPGSGAALRQSLEYLADYPYGCIEQTMSRFMPLLAAKQAGYITPALAKELPKMAAAGIAGIRANQRADGGFGWFGDGASDPMMSAYVYWGIGVSERLFGKSAELTQTKTRAFEFLRGALAAGGLSDFEKTYIMFAMAENGALYGSFADGVAKSAAAQGTYGKALSCIILQRSGRTDAARTLFAGIIAANAWAKNPAHRISASADERWENDGIETAAAMLLAASRVGADQTVIRSLEEILVNSRDGIAWKNSRDTAFAVLSLSESLRNSAKNAADVNLLAELNGAAVAELRLTPSQVESGSTMIALPDARIRSGANTIGVKKKDGAMVNVFASLKFFDNSPSFAPSNSGVSVERRYYRMKGEETSQGLRLSASETDAFTAGDLVMVELSVKRSKAGRGYLMIEDQLAPGFRPVMNDTLYYSNDLRKEYLLKQAYDDRVVLFAASGEAVIRYFLRAELPGSYRVLPASGSDMYYPQYSGTTADKKLRIDR